MVKPDIQNIHPVEELNESDFLSLKNAAKNYGYTQHHFGLLCRQGKLKSVRIGKKWLTKQEWIDEYFSELQNFYKSANHHYANGLEKIPVCVTKPIAVPKTESGIVQTGEIELRDLGSKKSDFENSKPDFGETALWPKFVFACSVFFLIISISSKVDFYPFKDFGKANLSSANFILNAVNPKLANGIKVKAESFAERTQTNTKAVLANPAEIFKTPDTALFLKRTKNNFYAFMADVRNAASTVKNFAMDTVKNLRQFANELRHFARLAVAPNEVEVKPPEGGLTSTELQTRDGMVVVPSGNDNENAIKMIKNSFSDEVVVKPDEEGDTGVIQPVFKEGRGDEYIFVLVPAKEKKVEIENEKANN